MIWRTVVSNNKGLDSSMGHMDTNVVLFLNDGICQLRQCGYTGPSIELREKLREKLPKITY